MLILCSNIDKPIIQKSLATTREGLSPFKLAVRNNHNAVILLLNSFKMIDSPTKLNIILEAVDDLIIAVKSNPEIFNVLISLTKNLSFHQHCQLYNRFLLKDDFVMSKEIYKQRICHLIYKLAHLNNESPLSYRTSFSQHLMEAHDEFLNSGQSRIDLRNFNRQFNILIR